MMGVLCARMDDFLHGSGDLAEMYSRRYHDQRLLYTHLVSYHAKHILTFTKPSPHFFPLFPFFLYAMEKT